MVVIRNTILPLTILRSGAIRIRTVNMPFPPTVLALILILYVHKTLDTIVTRVCYKNFMLINCNSMWAGKLAWSRTPTSNTIQVLIFGLILSFITLLTPFASNRMICKRHLYTVDHMLFFIAYKQYFFCLLSGRSVVCARMNTGSNTTRVCQQRLWYWGRCG